MPARKLDFYLNSSAPLRDLARAARHLNELQQILAKSAPPGLTQACRVKQLRAGTLVIAADNAAVASQLRQLAPRLLEAYRKQRSEVTSIRIDVQVANAVRQSVPTSQKNTLSVDSIVKIQELADRLEASPLKDALARMAARNRPPPPKGG
jgi:hypothetical protein